MEGIQGVDKGGKGSMDGKIHPLLTGPLLRSFLLVL